MLTTLYVCLTIWITLNIAVPILKYENFTPQVLISTMVNRTMWCLFIYLVKVYG